MIKDCAKEFYADECICESLKFENIQKTSCYCVNEGRKNETSLRTSNVSTPCERV